MQEIHFSLDFFDFFESFEFLLSPHNLFHKLIAPTLIKTMLRSFANLTLASTNRAYLQHVRYCDMIAP